jgi:ABC-2 type transport system permease protein
MSAEPFDVSKLGRPISGPTATGGDVRRFWTLARTLALTDFKLKFFGSVLGYVWQLMRPLLLFGVLYVVFTQIVNLSGKAPYFGIALLLGIVLYGCFSEATAGGVRCLIERENLVRKIDFPRLAVPVAVVLNALMNLGLNLIAVFVFLLISGGRVRLSWLELPFIIAVLIAFAFGFAMLLSVSFVKYRDVAPIWDVVLQALFYATPIFYTVQTIHGPHAEQIRRLLLCNPLGAIIQQARHVLIGRGYPSAAAAMGGAVWLLIPAAVTAGVCLWGFLVFRRGAPQVAELL